MAKDIPESIIAGAAMGGGQTQEHIQYNTETQVWVPVLHALTLIPTVLALVAGIYLLGAGLVNLARRCETTWDLFFFAVVITLGFVATASFILAIFDKLTDQPPRWLTIAAYLASIVWVMGLLNLIRLADGWTWLDSLRLPAAVALLIAGGLLAYRLTNELYNPLFPKSPTTEMLERYIQAQLDLQEPERVMVRRPIPMRVGNHRAALDWQCEAEPEPAPTGGPTVVDDDFVDLVAFVKRAVTHGWARDRHVRRPRLRLPSGRPLTRPLYDLLVDLAAEPWRLIRKSGIPGQSPEWLMEPDAAVTMLERVYRAQFDHEGHILPIDDPGRLAGNPAGRHPGE